MDKEAIDHNNKGERQMTEKSKNPIVEFFKKEDNFLSEEGVLLIKETDDLTIKTAIKEDPEVATALIYTANKNVDPYLRRKIFQVLS